MALEQLDEEPAPELEPVRRLAHLLASLGDGRVDADAEIRRARERIAAVA